MTKNMPFVSPNHAADTCVNAHDQDMICHTSSQTPAMPEAETPNVTCSRDMQVFTQLAMGIRDAYTIVAVSMDWPGLAWPYTTKILTHEHYGMTSCLSMCGSISESVSLS